MFIIINNGVKPKPSHWL